MPQVRIVFFWIGLVTVAAFWLVMPSALRAQSPISLDEYRTAIAQSLTLAHQANALQVSERAPLLKNAADTLDAIRAVQTAPGASVTVNNAELVALLRDASKTETAIKRLTALRDALAQPLATINPNDLTALRDILSRPPFTETVTDNLILQILRAIREFLDRLLFNTARGVFEARDLLIIVAIIAVAVVLFYFVYTLRRNLVTEEALAPPLMEQDARTPAEAFDNAQRFINAGDYRFAVRQLYLATLLILDQRGRIKYDPTLTNREYLRQAAQDPCAATALQPIVETFDRIWYGFEPITREEFDAYRRRVEQVREL